jgi:hypothetical protein
VKIDAFHVIFQSGLLIPLLFSFRSSDGIYHHQQVFLQTTVRGWRGWH